MPRSTLIVCSLLFANEQQTAIQHEDCDSRRRDYAKHVSLSEGL